MNVGKVVFLPTQQRVKRSTPLARAARSWQNLELRGRMNKTHSGGRMCQESLSLSLTVIR